MNKLKKLYHKFDKVSLLIKSVEDKINYCVINDKEYETYEYELEELEVKHHKIKSKIEYCKTKRKQLKFN
mgnify:CR=1 FL=1